ncbi:hypothetical protein NY08_2226 [Rhodococcus sp. B7740]|nr:hypothetical protein NY08_2226 [Rhodococcus sp. B7740]
MASLRITATAISSGSVNPRWTKQAAGQPVSEIPVVQRQ